MENAGHAQNLENPKRWPYVAILAAVALVSLLARAHLVQTRSTAGRLDGQEPESHILVTNLAYTQTPWETHHFLPIFTYGPTCNKFIDQHPGAGSPDEFGNYYYTSTPPLTFVLPYLASQLTGGPSLIAQRWYNLALQVAATMALAALVFRAAERPGVGFGTRATVATLAGVIYLTAPECLKSHTLTLWAQQFYAVLLPLQIYLLLYRPRPLLLFGCAALGCLEDWTPYVANVAMAGVAAFSWWRTRETGALKVCGALLGGCMAGGLAMIAWFTSILSPTEYFTNLAVRSGERAAGPFLDFVPSYLNSFGLFTLVGLAALWWRPWTRSAVSPAVQDRLILPNVDPLLVAVLIFICALVENILMKGHALLFSYDRLKGVQLLALLVAWGALASERRARVALGWCLIVGAVFARAVCF